MTATISNRASRSLPLPCPPLYGTPRSPERDTYGHLVAEVAQALGRPLLPHQRHMADVAMEIDPDTGLLAYSSVVLIGPRQVTGKTEWLLSMMTTRCTKFATYGPQRVLYTAQTADEARLKWRDVHLERLKKSPTLRPPRAFRARLTTNKEAFLWRNGSIWMPGSTTGKTGGTGDTLDVGVIDEAWSRENNRTELGMRPAMLTRRSAQLIVASMIPGISRALPGTWPYLKHKRQVGRARVGADVRRDVAFFDYAAPEGLDPFDPATWWLCMPGLGYITTEDKVRADFEDTDNLVDLEAEYLGWEPKETTPRWVLIRQETWRRCLDPSSRIEGRVALALEVDEDRETGLIAAAGYRADGHWHGEVVEPGYKVEAGTRGIEWMLRRTLDLWEDREPCTVVIDPLRPAGALIVPLRNKGVDVLTPSTYDIAGACGRWYDATGEKLTGEETEDDERLRFYHIGQPELDKSLGGAKPLDHGSGGAFTIVKRGSSSDLKALYGVILAMHGREVKGDIDYDVLDSVDVARRCRRCERQVYPANGLWLHAIDDTPEC